MDSGANGGFTAPEVTPWLPIGDPTTCNVEVQREKPGSVLTFVRDVIALRRRSVDLVSGDYRSAPSPDHTWVWRRRGSGTVIALNLSDSPARVGLPGADYAVAISTERERDGAIVEGGVDLGPWEGVVLETNSVG